MTRGNGERSTTLGGRELFTCRRNVTFSLLLIMITLSQFASLDIVTSYSDSKIGRKAASFRPDMKAELRRSVVKYRHLLQEESSRDHQQVDEESRILEAQEEAKETEEQAKVSAKKLSIEEKVGKGKKDGEVLSEKEMMFEEKIASVGQEQQHQQGKEFKNVEEVITMDAIEKSSEEVQQRAEESENSEKAKSNDTQEKSREKNSEELHEEKTVVEEVATKDETEQNSEQHEEEKNVTGENSADHNEQEPLGEGEKNDEPYVLPEPYLLLPTIKDWDNQRADWLENNPHMRLTPAGKPRVLIITGSQPAPCRSPVGDNFHLKSLKNKIDYSRMHNFEIYYNFVWLDPLFGGFWVKLPTVRNLMLTHPEIEWFLWVDSDAVFTDMLFEIPFDDYEGSDMVMWGWHDGFFKDKNWVAINAGVFFLRNSQWSLDLIDKWSPMGPNQVRDKVGKMLTAFLTQRQDNYEADDQSALAYLILTDDAIRAKVKLVQDDYKISGYWVDHVSHYEEYMEKYHPGLGDWRWPLITHFTGCSPCNGHNNPDYPYKMCMDNFNRAFNFADNQVLAYMGYQHVDLSSEKVIRTRNETTKPLEYLDINPWAERMAELGAAST